MLQGTDPAAPQRGDALSKQVHFELDTNTFSNDLLTIKASLSGLFLNVMNDYLMETY